MNNERYIAALEISSSKIIGTVGKTLGDGTLEIIATEQERGTDSVRYGIIQNLDETYTRVARIIDKLERRAQLAPRKISAVYVGLSGRSMKSIASEVSLRLPDETEITDDILDRLRSDARKAAIDNSLEVVDAVARKYRIEKDETTSPRGRVASSITATFDLIVCRPELKRNIIRAVTDKLGLEVEFVVTALATGHLILSDDQKRLGCMLVDLGAETTTITIYKNGYLRYFATLPLGGRNITRDLTSLNLLEERTEEIKLQSGNAMPANTGGNYNIGGVRMSDVNNIVVARSEEIVANIVEQMEYAGLKDTDLPGGIVCIGGGSRLNGMTDLIARQSNLKVRRGSLPPYIIVSGGSPSSHESLEVISIAYAGATLGNRECLQMEVQEELPAIGEIPDDNGDGEELQEKPEKPKRPSRVISSWKRRISGFFGSPEDDSDIIE